MVMKDDPMPQAISSLIVQAREEPSTSMDEELRSTFVRDFDVRPNVIIYQGRGNHNKEEQGSSRVDHGMSRSKDLRHGDEEMQTYN
ncbi:hypothetical protein CDL15_Pgr004240 [Punica granatum]|nr:hypothetical protein CDL15_Pgr004240 [Punica granatum]